jgi:hypothetical protein
VSLNESTATCGSMRGDAAAAAEWKETRHGG